MLRSDTGMVCCACCGFSLSGETSLLLGLDRFGTGRATMLIISTRRLLLEVTSGAFGPSCSHVCVLCSFGGGCTFVSAGLDLAAVCATLVCIPISNCVLVVTTLVFDAGLAAMVDMVRPLLSVFVFSKPDAVGISFWTGKGKQPSVAQSNVQLSVHSSGPIDPFPPLPKLASEISMCVEPGTMVIESGVRIGREVMFAVKGAPTIR